MITYKYIIVDDDDVDRLTLGLFLKDYVFLQHKASLSSAEDAISFFENNEVDILFLDIEMKGLNGLQLLEKVRDKISCAIFTTVHMKFAVESYNLNAFDYILKPYKEERIANCISKITSFMEMKDKAKLLDHSLNRDTLTFREGKNQVYLLVHEIVYLEAMKDYTKVHLLDKEKKSIVVHRNLGLLMTDIERFKSFVRVQKSYAVNKQYIRQMNATKLFLINDIVLPIGPSYKDDLMEVMS